MIANDIKVSLIMKKKGWFSIEGNIIKLVSAPKSLKEDFFSFIFSFPYKNIQKSE